MKQADLDREWTQDELRAHLIANGWGAADFREGQVIPQGAKHIRRPTKNELTQAATAKLLDRINKL